MRAFEFLIESQGGIIRRAQEVAQGKTVTFVKGDLRINLASTVVIPEDLPRFETTDELEQTLAETLDANGNPTVLYFSKVQPKHGAALITLWEDEAGKKYGFVKFANAKKPGAFPIVWTNADFSADTGFAQADNKIAQRAQFNLKPNALFPTDQYISAVGLSENIMSRTDLPPEVGDQIKQLLSNVADGNSTPVPGAEQYLSTYEIDLGESAAPIALVTGNFVSGSYQEAEAALLAPLGLTWGSVTNVLFPGGGSNLLYDSYLQLNKDTTLKVSSKDKKGGAAAAITGLMKEIEKNPERFSEVTDNPSYQEILEVVSDVSNNSAIQGPLVLAEKFGFIDSKDTANILNNYNKGQRYTPNVNWAQTPGIKAALQRKGAKFEDPAYDFGFHILAGVAELVADRLNKMQGIDNFFRAILERSTMIQVKAQMKKSGNGASFTNFAVIYPPTFTGSIKVVAGNNYMATRKPIGKISFKIG
jgi:hypothetical protein